MLSILRILLLLFLGLAPVACPHAEPQTSADALAVTAEPISHFEMEQPLRTRFGALEFRGGLVLTSPHANFGGLSAAVMEPDGAHFIALSDRTFWLRGRIVYRKDRPYALADVSMAPVLNEAGVPASRWDTESLARDGSLLYVGIEGKNRIARYDWGALSFRAPAHFLHPAPEFQTLPHNQGLEALVYVPRPHPLAGALLAISERALTADGSIKGFILGGPAPGAFSIRRSNDFDISDAALLPDGDLLILERSFSLFSGVAARMRRIPRSAIKPGALVDGPVIFEADMRCQIDNLEALAVHRAPSGDIILTLFSDDNFAAIQRTLLLQFVMR